MKVEYRVVWQREGQTRKVHMTYKTRVAAERCVVRQQTARDEMDWVNPPLTPIVFGPVIEERVVGSWRPVS